MLRISMEVGCPLFHAGETDQGVYLDFVKGIRPLLLYVKAEKVLGSTLGVTVLKACDFLASFLRFEFNSG